MELFVAQLGNQKYKQYIKYVYIVHYRVAFWWQPLYTVYIAKRYKTNRKEGKVDDFWDWCDWTDNSAVMDEEIFEAEDNNAYEDDEEY